MGRYIGHLTAGMGCPMRLFHGMLIGFPIVNHTMGICYQTADMGYPIDKPAQNDREATV